MKNKYWGEREQNQVNFPHFSSSLAAATFTHSQYKYAMQETWLNGWKMKGGKELTWPSHD